MFFNYKCDFRIHVQLNYEMRFNEDEEEGPGVCLSIKLLFHC